MSKLIFAIIFFSSIMTSYSQDFDPDFLKKDSNGNLKLSIKGASHFSSLALKCIHQEFPNKLGHVMAKTDDWQNPKNLHPAFYGCYDWHSAVHGHWMLIRLLKLYPEMPEASKIRQALAQNLTAQNILGEKAYFERKTAKNYERTYGWAWLLKLVEELHTWEDAQAKEWIKNLEPLTKLIIERYVEFLPKQTYPIRTGVHPNTAFGISFALDYARTSQNTDFEKLLVRRSLDYYKNDQNCPANWEPNGADFFSPCLLEAELMAKVLSGAKYKKWLNDFLPQIESNTKFNLLNPAIVSDRSDLQIVHLDGLNLSRVWCLKGISKYLDKDSKTQKTIKKAIAKHFKATLPNIANGDYAGEHWLASFAIYALTVN